MPPAGFGPSIPASERPQTHNLDRAVTVMVFIDMTYTMDIAAYNGVPLALMFRCSPFSLAPRGVLLCRPYVCVCYLSNEYLPRDRTTFSSFHLLRMFY